ncbi:MAG: MOSC domain-containing protein [Actinomycetota bacterium]|nr:MOSC domain-containing protein [Actinomycetota bacterium]
MNDVVRLLSVNVGKPAFFAMHRGRPVTSGIVKRPVTAETLWLEKVNLEGDGQADPDSHGGADKAVYAYPTEHLATWSAELGEDLTVAAFGENLSTAGWLEDDVGIGDRWQWGEAVLEVCQPRWPCYKLGIYRGSQKVPARFRETGRTGWYMRVLEPGRVPVAGPITVIERHPATITVRDVHEARLHGTTPERLAAMLDLAPLAEGWRHSLATRS